MRLVDPGTKPIKESTRRRYPVPFKDLDEPNQYAVGKDFTRAIERWEIEHGRDPGVKGVHDTPAHVPGTLASVLDRASRAVPRVRFLPISVKGGRVVEEPERPAARKVG